MDRPPGLGRGWAGFRRGWGQISEQRLTPHFQPAHTPHTACRPRGPLPRCPPLPQQCSPLPLPEPRGQGATALASRRVPPVGHTYVCLEKPRAMPPPRRPRTRWIPCRWARVSGMWRERVGLDSALSQPFCSGPGGPLLPLPLPLFTQVKAGQGAANWLLLRLLPLLPPARRGPEWARQRPKVQC